MNTFAEKLTTLYQPEENSSLASIKAEGWKHFLKLGAPTQKQEPFRYVRLRHLYALDLLKKRVEKAAKKEPPKPLEPTLTFIDGHFSKEYSAFPRELTVLPLAQAYATFGTFLKRRLKELNLQEKDPFASLNTAFFEEGVFVYVPPKVTLKAPLKIELIDTQSGVLSSPRIHLFLGKQSALTCHLTSQASASSWINAFCDISLEEQANLTLNSNFQGGWQTHALRALIKKEASFSAVTAYQSAQGLRHDATVALLGERSEATLQGAWHTKNQEEVHLNVLMKHLAPHTTSNQKFKGVLEGQSRSSFAGKIWVDAIAQKTEGFQQNHNLLLSDTAKAYAMPNLEIFADDVKASHGATIGQIAEEDLFYLKSRGLTSALARRLMIEGFTKEITRLLPWKL